MFIYTQVYNRITNKMSSSNTRTSQKNKSSNKSSFAQEFAAKLDKTDKEIKEITSKSPTSGLKSPAKINGDRYRKFEFYIDTENADYTFYDEFKDITAPLMVRSKVDDMFVKQPNSKVLIHSWDFEKLLGGNYAYLPHGKIEQVTNKIIGSELKNENIVLLKKEEAHRGHTQYWKYMSEEKFKIAGDDNIQVGFCVRNGYDTGVALGIDVFTFRLLCKNGAIARGKNLASVSLRHVGDTEKLTKLFSDSIKDVMVNAKEIIKYYRKATQIQVGKELANQMYQKLAKLGETYLPSNWNVLNTVELKKVMKEGKFKGNMNLITVSKPTSLWQVFNDITAAQRQQLEAKKTGFPQVVKAQDRLHQSLFQIVQQKGGI